MKKYLAGLLAAALCIGVFGTASAARRLEIRQGVWRTSASNERGYVDSTTASINGAVQTVDTAYVDLSGLVWDNGAINTTTFGVARLWLCSTTNTSSDTLFYAVEPIAPDGQAVPSTSFNNAIAVTAGDEAIAAVISMDADAVLPNLAWCNRVRLRVRADGNTGALFPDAKVYVAFWVDE